MIREDVVKEAITNTIYSDKHKMEAISLIKSEACKARIAESLIEDENKLKQYLDNYFRALEGFVKRLEVFCKFGGSLFARLLSFYTNKPH